MRKFNSNNNNDCSYEHRFRKWNTGTSHALPKDESGYCIFHSTDLAWKRTNNCSDYLKEYINGCILDEQTGIIDLENITLVSNSNDRSINLNGLLFTKLLNIKNCIIADPLDMKKCTFEDFVDIYNTTFEKTFNCRNSIFKDRTQFNNCTFQKPAYFNDAIFYAKGRLSYLSFTDSVFNEQANFSDITYLGVETDVNFQLVTFEHNVYFSGSRFERQAIFNGATFKANADFRRITFENTVQFNPRLQNDTTHTVKFTTADFSGTIFQGSVQFQEATFNQEATFEGIQVKPNSNILFRGNEQHKAFQRPVNFNVTYDSIEGVILFEKVNVFWISRNQLTILNQLEQAARVYFIDCNFESHVIIIPYVLNGGTGSYAVLQKILEGLKEWVSLFTNNIQAYLILDNTQCASNKLNIKIVYKRDEDYILFQKLAKYFFECLQFNDYNTSAILDKISGSSFLNTFSAEENFHYSNLKDRLNYILKDLRRYWAFYLISSEKNLITDKPTITAPAKNSDLPEEEFSLSEVSSAISYVVDTFNAKLQSLGKEGIKLQRNEAIDSLNIKFEINLIIMEGNVITQNGDGAMIFGPVKDTEINIHSFNHLKGVNGNELAEILQKLTTEITNSQNQEAIDYLEELKKEIAKPAPKRKVLMGWWKFIIDALPHLKTISEIGEKFIPLINAIGG